MKLFDDEINQIPCQPLCDNSCNENGNNWDIFDPSVYTPDGSKYRADYIKSISAKVGEITLDTTEASTPGTPEILIQTSGPDTRKNIHFIFKHIVGIEGPPGPKSVSKITEQLFLLMQNQGLIEEDQWYFLTNNNVITKIYSGNTLFAITENNTVAATPSVTEYIDLHLKPFEKYPTYLDFPVVGKTNVFYIALDSGNTWIYDNGAYVPTGESWKNITEIVGTII